MEWTIAQRAAQMEREGVDINDAPFKILAEVNAAPPDERDELLLPLIWNAVRIAYRQPVRLAEQRYVRYAPISETPRVGDDPSAERKIRAQTMTFVPGAGRVAWGEITVEQHHAAAAYWNLRGESILDRASLHTFAGTTCAEAGVDTLNALAKKRKTTIDKILAQFSAGTIQRPSTSLQASLPDSSERSKARSAFPTVVATAPISRPESTPFASPIRDSTQGAPPSPATKLATDTSTTPRQGKSRSGATLLARSNRRSPRSRTRAGAKP